MPFSPGGVVSEPSLDPGALGVGWDRAIEILTDRGELSGAQLAFVRLTKPLGIIDDTVLLAVPSEFAKDSIETRARDSIINSLSAARSEERRVGKECRAGWWPGQERQKRKTVRSGRSGNMEP